MAKTSRQARANSEAVAATQSFQRARRPEQKEQRREEILAAAADLARRDGVRAVSLSDIARAVGIHKSALLRYFETREQIFLELTAREWRDWEAKVMAALGTIAAGDAEAVAATLARSFVSRPLLCDLLPHAALNLERHASIEAVRVYKQTSTGAVAAVAAALAGPLPELDEEERGEAVSYVALLAGSMYQIATPPEPLARLYEEEPRLGHFLLDLEGRLARAARVLIAGLRALG
ncbi:MAG TPA: TetR family transcriptional regulator [Solirubrobacterales bacterium]